MRRLINRLFRKRRATEPTTPAAAKIDRSFTEPGSYTLIAHFKEPPKPGRYDSPYVLFLKTPKADD